MNKILKLTSVIILPSIILLVILYFVFNHFKGDQAKPMSFISEESAIVLELEKMGVDFVQEFKETAWFGELGEFDHGDLIKNALSQYDFKELKASQKALSNSVWMAVQNDKMNNPQVLFVFPFNLGKDDSPQMKFLQNLFNKDQVQHLESGRGNFILNSTQDQSQVFLKAKDGIVLASVKADIIEAALNSHKSSSNLACDTSFLDLRKTNGKHVAGHLYLNYQALSKPLKMILGDSQSENRVDIADFAQWTSSDIVLRNQEILLSGFTSLNSSDDWMTALKGQAPQKAKSIKLLPYSTIMLMEMGFSDFKVAYDHHKETLKQHHALEDFLRPQYVLEKKYKININQDLIAKIGSECGMAYFLNAQNKTKPIFFFQSNDNRAMRKQLQRLLNKAKPADAITNYQGEKIYHIGIDNLIPSVFGKQFAAINQTYYLCIDDFVFFSSESASLEFFINTYKNGKTLDVNPNFASFADNLSGKSNLLFYFNIHHGLPWLKSFLAAPFLSFLEKSQQAVQNIEAIAFECSSGKELWYTNMSVKNNTAYKEESSSAWIYSLDEVAAGKAYLLSNHLSRTENLLVSDEANQLYLIDAFGGLIWKKQLDGPLLSQVFAVDYYKNGKSQYMFNTANKLYLVDLNGQDVERYPIAFTKTAENGISVFDYDNKKNYRIFFAGEDQRVYNIDIKGNRVNGWSIPKIQAPIKEEIAFLRLGNKDYLVISNDKGYPTITDRRGKTRIRVDSEFQKAKHSSYYVNQTNSKGPIITTNPEGRLVYIQTNGNLAFTDFGTFSKEHYFLYADMDQKNGKDFIYIDGDRLAVFNRFKKKILDQKLPAPIANKPQLCVFPNGKRYIAISLSGKKEVVLIDRMGNMLNNMPYEGGVPFVVGNFNSKQSEHLIVAKGNKIFNYILK